MNERKRNNDGANALRGPAQGRPCLECVRVLASTQAHEASDSFLPPPVSAELAPDAAEPLRDAEEIESLTWLKAVEEEEGAMLAVPRLMKEDCSRVAQISSRAGSPGLRTHPSLLRPESATRQRPLVILLVLAYDRHERRGPRGWHWRRFVTLFRLLGDHVVRHLVARHPEVGSERRARGRAGAGGKFEGSRRGPRESQLRSGGKVGVDDGTIRETEERPRG